MTEEKNQNKLQTVSFYSNVAFLTVVTSMTRRINFVCELFYTQIK